MPNRSKGKNQIKSDPLVLQLEVGRRVKTLPRRKKHMLQKPDTLMIQFKTRVLLPRP